MIRHVPALATVALTAAMSAGLAQEGSIPASSVDGRPLVAVHGERVTASVRNVPLVTVLEEFATRTRVTIVPAPGLENDVVSAELKNVAVDEALRSLLKSYDTFLYYSPSGPSARAALATVWVYPRGTAATLRPVPAETWASTKDLEIALRDSDATVRESAYEALMSRPDRASRELLLLAIRGATEPDNELRERLLSTALSKNIDISRDVLADLVRADATATIRLIALDALSTDPAARDTALAALMDPSETVRDRAKELLSELESLSRRRE